MTEKKTWFITGAGRGMGTDIAMQHQIEALRELSTSPALDDLQPAATGS